MKIAPFVRELARFPECFDARLVHTGQHYDREMSDAFFRDLGIPHPDVHLGIGSGTHAEQVGHTMMAFEKTVRSWRPDLVVVVGDVNATCACAVTAKKECLMLAHIEAGLRSFDMTMPEEVNRIVTDRLSDLLFTTDEIADANLAREGAAPGQIARVGNIMIDTLEEERHSAEALNPDRIAAGNGLVPGQPLPALADGAYSLLTLHRPSNVDDREALTGLVRYLLDELAPQMPVAWPMHPRCRKQIEAAGLWEQVRSCGRIALLKPLGYRETLRLNMGASVVLTDSGGLQEECCVLGTPCITLRENTERPVTLRERGGSSVLTGHDVARIREAVRLQIGVPRRSSRPPMWDGHTAERIVEVLRGTLCGR
jgi:UDP-N-acetylglucosamine 2-epimerase (non-hydrolysing)